MGENNTPTALKGCGVKTIDDELSKYALPVYHFNFLIGNYKNLVFTIGDDLFLELLFLKIRGKKN